MKINFNMSSIQNTIIPSLNNSIDLLNSVINKEYKLYVPRTFAYYNRLKEMQSDNIYTKNSLVNVRDYIYKLNKSLDDSLNEISGELRLIDHIQIGKRQSSIK